MQDTAPINLIVGQKHPSQSGSQSGSRQSFLGVASPMKVHESMSPWRSSTYVSHSSLLCIFFPLSAAHSALETIQAFPSLGHIVLFSKRNQCLRLCNSPATEAPLNQTESMECGRSIGDANGCYFFTRFIEMSWKRPSCSWPPKLERREKLGKWFAKTLHVQAAKKTLAFQCFMQSSIKNV